VKARPLEIRGGVARRALLALALSLSVVIGCEDSGKKSASLAQGHLAFLVKAAKSDAREVRDGLPEGAKMLAALFQEAAPEVPGAEDARKALIRTRAKVNDLDSAKSTFFLVATADGTILRNNLDQDDMAGKNLFDVYPAAEKNKKKAYYEFSGSWDVARGVNGRDDAQRCAAAPILLKDEVVGYLATGWSWSAYAYRLESTLRSDILSNTKEGEKVPLVYVYVLVGSIAYGAPVSPVINGKELLKLDPLKKVQGDKVWSTPLEIDYRAFGVAMQRVPELGQDVLIAVLRSET
jgi:hypothetical protein